MGRLKDRIAGKYATGVDLPVSSAVRRFQIFSRKIRGKKESMVQATSLPRVGWRTVFPSGAVYLLEKEKHNGNVRLAELGVLCHAASRCPQGRNVFEIGTFDGRTTLNLARNVPGDCRVFTLDLPPDHETSYSLEPGERHFVEKPESGKRYKNCLPEYRAYAGRIKQLLGDSASFDFSDYLGTCGLVFVDGSHAYEYAWKDSITALELVTPGGVIVWHDYGVWEGVTRALEQLETERGLGLLHIKGTSLVVLKDAPGPSGARGPYKQELVRPQP